MPSSVREVTLIREIVRDCAGLSRMELARTVCELLRWRRPNGRLKARECREFLERLDAGGALVLPDKRQGRATGSVTRVPRTAAGEPGRPLLGSVRDVDPLQVELVREPAQRLLFRELVGRYHYLGHTVPFGAHLRYLVFASRPARAVVGCLQFPSPAWRMAARDRWVGWDDATRARNLQRVVNNSRFLLLPWVAVRNLASAVLARGLGQLVVDWPRHYKLEPWLVETLVDPRRHHGGSYRAANWVALGATSGRGRMDRYGRRAGEAPKTVLVYPVVRDAQRRLRESWAPRSTQPGGGRRSGRGGRRCRALGAAACTNATWRRSSARCRSSGWATRGLATRVCIRSMPRSTCRGSVTRLRCGAGWRRRPPRGPSTKRCSICLAAPGRRCPSVSGTVGGSGG